MFFHAKPLEQPVILNLLFQNTHGPFKIVVFDLNHDFFQKIPPFTCKFGYPEKRNDFP